MISSLHHIEIGSRKPELLVTKLASQYGFIPYAHRNVAGLKQVVMTAGKGIFIVVTELSEEKISAFEGHTPPAFTPGVGVDDLRTRMDSVYNIAFEIDDISKIGKHLVAKRNIAPTIQSGVVEDDCGSVRYVTIKSCVGDVCHTLLDKSDYGGSFLPTYSRLDAPANEIPSASLSDIYNHIDHVAFGLAEGDSPKVLEWYIDVLKFCRLMTSPQESRKDGLVVMAGNTGLCIRAMEAPGSKPPFSIVLTEPACINDTGATNNQKLYLEHHGGPGVHHVALSTFNIVRTISRLEEKGVNFVPNPPAEYYDDVEFIFSNSRYPLFVPELKEHGILVDTERTGLVSLLDWLGLPLLKSGERFILQRFCRPIVDGTGETAFFEIIERRNGAKAFGAGNVAALWKALVKHLEQEKLKKETSSLPSRNSENIAY